MSVFLNQTLLNNQILLKIVKLKLLLFKKVNTTTKRKKRKNEKMCLLIFKTFKSLMSGKENVLFMENSDFENKTGFWTGDDFQ